MLDRKGIHRILKIYINDSRVFSIDIFVLLQLLCEVLHCPEDKEHPDRKELFRTVVLLYHT